jgi:hypothetical protein
MNYDQNQDQPQSNIMSQMTHQNLLDPSIVQMRLDTESTLELIELNLSGKKKVVQTLDNGSQRIVLIQVLDPMCNIQGIHSIMMRMRSIINVPVVQANFKEQWYLNYCADVRQSLNDAFVLNQDEWGIQDSKYELVLDMILDTVEPYLSRTLNNEERKSLSGFTSTERIGESKRSGGLFGLFSD